MINLGDIKNWLGVTTQPKDNSLSADYDATKIITDYESALYNLSLYNPYNPDPLVIRKTLNVYDDIFAEEEQAQALLTLKKSFVIGDGWNIKSDEIEDDKLNEIKDFIAFCFDTNYSGLFYDALEDILTSYQFGFSVSEIVLNQIKDGKYKGKIALSKLITRPPHSFEFKINPQGEIINLTQNCMSTIKQNLPLNKFFIYTNKTQFGNPYGVSDFRTLYRWYIFKDMLIKFAAIAGERNSMPYAIAKVPKNTLSSARVTFLTILSRMQSKGCAVVDDDSKIELLESAKAGNQDYFRTMIELCDNQMAKAFVFPELLGLSTHSSGSQALGREQFDIYLKAVPYPQKLRLEDMISERIIKPLVDMNYGKQDNYPWFEFNKFDNTKELLASYILAVEKGVIKNTIEDENLVREKLGHPEREEYDDEEMPVSQEPTEEPEVNEPIIEDVKKSELPFEDEKEMAEPIVDDIEYRRKLTQFEEQISLNTIKNDIEKQEQDFALNLYSVIEEIKSELENKIIKDKIVENKKFNKVNEIVISNALLGSLKNTFSRGLNSTYKVAKQVAKEDLPKKEFAEKQYTIGAIEPKESIKYLTSKGISLTGTEEEFILKGVRNILTDGLKTGKTQSQVISNLEEFFKVYSVGQLDGKGNIVNINEIGGRLSTIIRTNLNDAYNQGRMALYNDPDVKGFVEALQYSAIMDADTTDFCSSMDGKIYPASDAIWDTITPPNHFNCRSILIAIFQGEKYDVAEKPKTQPAKGFGGNE